METLSDGGATGNHGPLCPQPLAAFDVAGFVHVTSVDESIVFYQRLGLKVGDVLRPSSGEPAFWAMMLAGKTRFMLAQSSGPIDPTVQAVLFYLYAPDVRGLLAHLLAAGVSDGGVFTGCPTPTNRAGVVFRPTSPPYMPDGEIRVHDPDGYCLLVGQSGWPR